MVTTALFVEILIVGLEAASWLVLLILLFSGSIKVDLAQLKDWSSLIGVFVLTGAYVLGILVDRLADSVYDGFGKSRLGRFLSARFAGERPEASPRDIAEMRLTIMKESDGIARFTEYQRSRMRIARGALLNLAVALPVGVAYVAVWHGNVRVLAAMLLVGMALIAGSLFAADRIHDANIKRLTDAHKLIKASRKDTA